MIEFEIVEHKIQVFVHSVDMPLRDNVQLYYL